MQALILLRSQKSVTNNKAALTMQFPGARGIYLHAQGSDSRSADRLLMKKEALATRLSIDLGEDWTEDSPQFKAAAATLGASMVNHYERIAEGLVFKCKQIKEKLHKESPGKNAVRLTKNLTATRKCVFYVFKEAPWLLAKKTHNAHPCPLQEHPGPSERARHLAGFRRDPRPCRRG